MKNILKSFISRGIFFIMNTKNPLLSDFKGLSTFYFRRISSFFYKKGNITTFFHSSIEESKISKVIHLFLNRDEQFEIFIYFCTHE